MYDFLFSYKKFSFVFKPSRLPGEKINLIVLYESTRLMNDVVFESNEPSNQTDLGDSSKIGYNVIKNEKNIILF